MVGVPNTECRQNYKGAEGMNEKAASAGISGRGKELLADAIIWDNHACMPVRPGDVEYLDDLERHRRSGASFVSLNVSFDQFPWHLGFKMLATFRSWIKRHPERYLLVDGVRDIHRAKRAGKLGVAFDLEGAVAVDDLPELVEPYYALGVRWMLIAYNRNNRLGGGCQDDDAGLTEFGRRVIDEMERVGMVLCCSHTGYRTAREAMEYSRNPVIFSHSNPRALWDHERNIPDDLIKACAASGGVVSINGIGIFLGDNDNSTEAIVRHIDYVAALVGPQHVGLGLDFVFDPSELDALVENSPELFPPEKGYRKGLRMVEPEQIPEIADRLLHLGWDDDAVLGLLGGNNLRVAEQVWR